MEKLALFESDDEDGNLGPIEDVTPVVEVSSPPKEVATTAPVRIEPVAEPEPEVVQEEEEEDKDQEHVITWGNFMAMLTKIENKARYKQVTKIKAGHTLRNDASRSKITIKEIMGMQYSIESLISRLSQEKHITKQERRKYYDQVHDMMNAQLGVPKSYPSLYNDLSKLHNELKVLGDRAREIMTKKVRAEEEKKPAAKKLKKDK